MSLLYFLLAWATLPYLVTTLTVDQMKAAIDKNSPPNNCYRSYRAPLDVIFVIHHSASSKVKGILPKVDGIIDILAKDYPGTRFGASFYADFQCSDRHTPAECAAAVKDKKEHDKPDGCYKLGPVLTRDKEYIKSFMKDYPLMDGNSGKAGMMGLLMTGSDHMHGWSVTNAGDVKRNRILFLITDEGTTCCSKPSGSKTAPVGDGSDRCTTDNPTPEFVGETLKQRGISLYVGLMKKGNGEDVFENWKGMTAKMPIENAYSNLDTDDADKIGGDFREFLIRAVYNRGTVPCTKTYSYPRIPQTFMSQVSKPPTCYRNPMAPLDMILVIDRTSDKVKNAMTKVSSIVDILAKEYPGSRFGVSSYADFQCSDWHTPADCKIMVSQQLEHDTPEGCYSFVESLTEDVDLVKKALGSIPPIGGNSVEAGIMAILMAVADPKHKLILPSSPNVAEGRNRIVFLITDDGTNCCAKRFGIQNPPLGDGTDTCSATNNPTPEFVGKLMKQHGINLYLGLVTNGRGFEVDVYENWNDMTTRMPITAEQVNLMAEESNQVVEKFRQFMVSVVYDQGTIPCKTQEPTGEYHEPSRDQIFIPKLSNPPSCGAGPCKPVNTMSYEDLINAVERTRPPVCYRNPKAPLDIVLLADQSDPEMKSIVLKVVNVLDDLHKEFPGSRFGLNYYSDFWCLDWNSQERCEELVRDDWSHMNPEGCYRFNTSLTTDVSVVKKHVRKMGYVSSINKESGVAALMMTAADPKVDWDGGKDKHRNRVIFVVTNEGTHCCGKYFGIKNPPKGDGSDTCKEMNNPEPAFVGKLLREKNINLFLALNNGQPDLDTFNDWREMSQRMGVAFAMANTEADSNDAIFKKFRQFVLSVIYAEGQVPC